MAEAQGGRCLRVQLDPVEAAMPGVGVDTEDRAGIPPFRDADPGIEVDAHAVADVDFVHVNLPAS